jgi:dipeptidyl aminopeptidase/acylaminoacyl peptidase
MRYQVRICVAGLLLAICGGCGPSAATSRAKVDGPNETAEAVPVPQPAAADANSPDADLAAIPPAGTAPANSPAANALADASNKTKENARVHSKPAGKEPAYLKGEKLIPREVLFGNPDKAAARLSHDGKQLAYLAPVDGVLNVWVGPVDDPDKAKPVTKDKKRGIRTYFWAYTNEHILYLQDIGGDENWHVYSVHLASGKEQDLTPLDKVNAQVEQVSHKFPPEILVGLNNRDPKYHDIYRVNLETGKRELIQENKEGFDGYVTDDDYRIRFATRFTDDGGREMLEPDGKDGWKKFLKIPMEDSATTSPLGFDKSGENLYLSDSRGRDTSALKELNIKTGKEKLIAENDKADVGGIISHPVENTIEAVSFTYLRTEWKSLTDEIKADFEYLGKVDDGEVNVTSQTLDDEHWTVAFIKDDGPVKYYVYDRKPERKARFLFTNRRALEGLPLVKMHSLVIKARDGLELVSYLSLPPNTDNGKGRPKQPLPMVLDVHGGPWVRDDWGYNSTHQLWANRGYAVLSINYRGSNGLGKKFLNAGNLEWGGKMQDDLTDAVQWCIDQKIADADKVAITGGSYGGYATLEGVTKTPELYACGVDIVGPSNILTLLATIPPYWESAKQLFKDRVGDWSTEEGRKFLADRSPLSHVDKIKRPLLIGQGANDPRVKQSEADQIVKAMQHKHIPVTYVLFPDEGHGFARPPNSLAFHAVTEAFLAEHLGGRYEPIGDAFKGSTIKVPAGADDVPGLKAAIEQHAASEPRDKSGDEKPEADKSE